MSPPLRLRTIFAVPFVQGRLADCQELNQALARLFLARQTDADRNPSPSHAPQAETFESRFNLFSWPEPCVQQLRTLLLGSVVQAIQATTDLSQKALQSLTMHNHTWYHVSRYAGSFVAHNHPLASWSAVYCVQPGEASESHPASGVLRFLDTRIGADAFQDSTNRALHAQFAVRPLELHLEAGELVVFPAYLHHEVGPFYGRDTRITVATNCWFT